MEVSKITSIELAVRIVNSMWICFISRCIEEVAIGVRQLVAFGVSHCYALVHAYFSSTEPRVNGIILVVVVFQHDHCVLVEIHGICTLRRHEWHINFCPLLDCLELLLEIYCPTCIVDRLIAALSCCSICSLLSQLSASVTLKLLLDLLQAELPPTSVLARIVRVLLVNPVQKWRLVRRRRPTVVFAQTVLCVHRSLEIKLEWYEI